MVELFFESCFNVCQSPGISCFLQDTSNRTKQSLGIFAAPLRALGCIWTSSKVQGTPFLCNRMISQSINVGVFSLKWPGPKIGEGILVPMCSFPWGSFAQRPKAEVPTWLFWCWLKDYDKYFWWQLKSKTELPEAKKKKKKTSIRVGGSKAGQC